MNKFLLNAALSFAALSAGAVTNAEMEKLALEHECTSWMVFNDLTKNNTNILHKNRDATSEKISVMISPAGAKRRWIFLGSNSANSGMNSSGLASVVNSGELCPDPAEDKTKKTTPALVRDVLENCDTAAQAVERLRTLVTAGDYNHGKKGSIFFFMDTKEAYICELTIKVFTAQRYDRGYAVRANIWQNPGMQAHSRNTIKGYLNSSARAYIAYSNLNKALEKNGRISVQDFPVTVSCLRSLRRSVPSASSAPIPPALLKSTFTIRMCFPPVTSPSVIPATRSTSRCRYVQKKFCLPWVIFPGARPLSNG